MKNDEDGSAREARLRHAVNLRGYVLGKSRRRDPRSADFGKFWVIDPRINGVLNWNGWGATLDDIEDWLNS